MIVHCFCHFVVRVMDFRVVIVLFDWLLCTYMCMSMLTEEIQYKNFLNDIYRKKCFTNEDDNMIRMHSTIYHALCVSPIQVMYSTWCIIKVGTDTSY